MKHPRYPAYQDSGAPWLPPVRLSSLIVRLNERFGTDFTPAGQLFFESVRAEAQERAELREAALANNEDDYGLVLENELDGIFIGRMEGNEEAFRRVMENEKLRAVLFAWMRGETYRRFRDGVTGNA